MSREEVTAILGEAGGVVREAVASPGARSTPNFPSVEYTVVREPGRPRKPLIERILGRAKPGPLIGQ